MTRQETINLIKRRFPQWRERQDHRRMLNAMIRNARRKPEWLPFWPDVPPEINACNRQRD